MNRLLFILLLCTSPSIIYAQDWVPEELRNTTTTNVSKNKKSKPPKKTEKDMIFIIKNNPKKILYGNPCMHTETKNMGFEYVLQKPGLPGTLGTTRRILHNTAAYARLTFTRSPFWKMKLNRRVKDCREKSGDWVG